MRKEIGPYELSWRRYFREGGNVSASINKKQIANHFATSLSWIERDSKIEEDGGIELLKEKIKDFFLRNRGVIDEDTRRAIIVEAARMALVRPMRDPGTGVLKRGIATFNCLYDFFAEEKASLFKEFFHHLVMHLNGGPNTAGVVIEPTKLHLRMVDLVAQKLGESFFRKNNSKVFLWSILTARIESINQQC